MSPSDDANRPYVVLTGDTHAGAPIEMYREYLDPAYRDQFDATRNPASISYLR